MEVNFHRTEVAKNKDISQLFLTTLFIKLKSDIDK